MKKIILIAISLSLFLTACAQVQLLTPLPEATQMPPTPTVTIVPPTATPSVFTSAEGAAIQTLATALGVAPARVTLISDEALDWPNGCMGVVKIGVMCTQLVTPGHRIVLDANGRHYELHTNADGSSVLPEQPTLSPSAAIQSAVAQLAVKLAVKPDDIQVTSVTMMEWSDACLGVAKTDGVCAQMITPGYLIVLSSGGKDYEFHASADASSVLLFEN